MPRGRTYVEEYESDSSDYGPAIVVEKKKKKDKVKYAAAPAPPPPMVHRHSHAYTAHRGSSPAPVVIENVLKLPEQHRQRASSTSGQPMPNFLPVYIPQPAASRSPSRERVKHYHYHRSSSSESGSSRHSRHGRRRSSHHPQGEDDLPYEYRRKLERLKIMEEEKEREAAEEKAIRDFEARKKKDKEKEERILLDLEEKKRKAKDEEARFMLEVEERKRKQKVEEAEVIRKAEEKRRLEKEEHELLRAQYLREAKEKEEKDKAEKEATRLRVLREEKEREDKEKEKKKKEEEEFQMKVKERFLKAGYSPEYIEDILEEKKKKKEHRDQELAIDLSRPTYIRVQRKHLHPDTLDHYGLPWEWDKTDGNYIIIKKYISHSLQQELFEHTVKITKERKLITGGYTKETITTLKPANVYKDKDEMYLVRRKSRSPSRRNWMFT